VRRRLKGAARERGSSLIRRLRAGGESRLHHIGFGVLNLFAVEVVAVE